MIESLLWKARELYNRIVSFGMHINSNLRLLSNSNIHFISSLSHRVPKNFNQLANFNSHINCETSALYYQYYIRRGISNNSPIHNVFIVKASYLGQQSISHHRVDAIVKSLVQCFLWSGGKFSHSVIQKIWQTHWERSSMRTFRCSHIWNTNDIIALWAAAKNKKLRRNQEWAPMQQGKSSGVHLKDEIVENFFFVLSNHRKKPKTISTYNYNLIKTNLYIFSYWLVNFIPSTLDFIQSLTRDFCTMKNQAILCDLCRHCWGHCRRLRRLQFFISCSRHFHHLPLITCVVSPK